MAAACQQISFALGKLPATMIHVDDTACSMGVDCDGHLTAVVWTCEEFVAHAKHWCYLFVWETCRKISIFLFKGQGL